MFSNANDGMSLTYTYYNILHTLNSILITNEKKLCSWPIYWQGSFTEHLLQFLLGRCNILPAIPSLTEKWVCRRLLMTYVLCLLQSLMLRYIVCKFLLIAAIHYNLIVFI